MSEISERCGSCRFYLETDTTSEDPSGVCRRNPPTIHVTQWVGQPMPPPLRAGTPAPPQIAYQVTGVAAAFLTMSAQNGWCGEWDGATAS